MLALFVVEPVLLFHAGQMLWSIEALTVRFRRSGP
jgi:hypothetical protein